MRIAVFDAYRLGVLTADGIHDVTEVLPQWTPDLGPSLINDFIARFDQLRGQVEKLVARTVARPLDEVVLRPAVPRPTHVFAAPLNYRAHRDEMRGPTGSTGGTAAELGFFLKASGSISGPYDAIELPSRPGRRFDHEGEIAFVLGREARAVPRSQALDYIFGYTMLVDVTMRMTERQREERTMRKSFASFAPIGPCILTADEVGDPRDLSLRLWVNGELRQDACLRDLIVDIPALIEQASSVLPLQPGDVYATGSPAGVGQIQPGDEVAVECAPIGRMTLTVRSRPW